MARALSRDTRLLVLDEPSAVLDQEEVKNLFRVIRDLTAEGVAVVYISHRLEEIREIGDRITVLKDGRTVATGLAVADTPTSELIKLMTGRSIEYVFPPRPDDDPRPRRRRSSRCRTSAWPACSRASNLTVHAGEIVGLAGLVGAGRSEIVETLYGARKASAGTRHRRRQEAAPRLGQPARCAAGMGLAPEERKSQGLLLDEAVYRNITVSSMAPVRPPGLPQPRRGAAPGRRADHQPRRTSRRRHPRGAHPVGRQPAEDRARPLADARLPGAAARRAHPRRRRRRPQSEIYQLIRSLADRGVAVVVVSSEIEEVLGLADRVLVVREGVVVHESAATAIDEAKVLDLVMEGKVPA